MGCLVVLILLARIFGGATFLAIGLIGLLFTLIVAGIVGWAADLVIPGGALPGGSLGAVLTGLIGGFVGAWLFHQLGWSLGIDLFGVHVIPAFVGAVGVALAAQLFTARRPIV